jgi:hypothetical protein
MQQDLKEFQQHVDEYLRNQGSVMHYNIDKSLSLSAEIQRGSSR